MDPMTVEHFVHPLMAWVLAEAARRDRTGFDTTDLTLWLGSPSDTKGWKAYNSIAMELILNLASHDLLRMEASGYWRVQPDAAARAAAMVAEMNNGVKVPWTKESRARSKSVADDYKRSQKVVTLGARQRGSTRK